MRNPISENESTRISRESKCLPDNFCEYDKYNLSNIDYLSFEVQIKLKRKVKNHKILISMLNVSSNGIGTFDTNSKNDEFIDSISYTTDSEIEMNETFLEYLKSLIDSNIAELKRIDRNLEIS